MEARRYRMTSPEPSPTPEAAAFTVSSASINVRSGPGTTFPVIGRLIQGQSFPIAGKSEDGTSKMTAELAFGPYLAAAAVFYLFAEPWIELHFRLTGN